MFFISYAKNFFVPPSQFGVGLASPVMSLSNALESATGGRDKVVLIHNGYSGGDIGNVVNQLSETIVSAGKNVTILYSDSELSSVCPSSLRGVTRCFGAANFFSSPTQGPNGTWNYTLLADGALGERIYVNRNDNDAQLFVLPLQHEIDRVIASVAGGAQMPQVVLQYPFTTQNDAERGREITRMYQNTLISVIAVAFFIGICGVTYQLTGHMALERERGMSSLIESMMPNKRRWEPQAARLIATHLAFDIVYLPAWIIMGAIIKGLVFPDTNVGIMILLHILIGFSLCSCSIFAASFFSRAQVSGITVVIISLVLAIIAQIPLGKDASTGAVILLGLIFPPMTYIFFIIATAGFQQIEHPMSLGEYSPAMDWQVTGGTLLGLMAVQVVVYPLLAALVERLLYNTASRSRTITYSNEPSSVAVRLDHFSKHYRPSWFARKILGCGRRSKDTVVKAVNDVSMDLIAGSITILLGANGSGKSTTLRAISGTDTVTSGSITIDGTGGLGLCPQNNVMWDEVTVREHVRIFDQLKSTGAKASREGIQTLIDACDLAVKRDARSGTLSGGQKRKLQLAMMFSGGSRVCCVDEVSSGIDPLARRKIWDILLAERGKRSILLTTHFLDEADVLSDHIAVYSRGVLKAEGTSVELKHKLGGGYRIYVDKSIHYTPDLNGPGVERHSDYEYNVYQSPDSATAAAIMADLDNNGVEDYRVQGPTVEDVFLKLADEIKDDFGTGGTAQTITNMNMDETASTEEKAAKIDAPVSNLGKPRMNLTTGQGTGLLRQTWILLCKRFVVLKSNYVPYLLAFIVPVATGGLVTLFLRNFDALSCNPADLINSQEISQLSSLVTVDAVYGPQDQIPVQSLESTYPQLNSSSLHSVDSIQSFNAYVTDNYRNVTPGGIWTGQGGPVFAFVANQGIFFPVIVQNLIDSILTQRSITTAYQPFATSFSPRAGDTLQVILYFGLAMSAYPAFFALYPTAERLRKVRALHYSNGVRSLPLWTAYVLFDFVFVMAVSVIVAIIWAASWSGWYGLGYVFVVFFLYGLTSVALSYCVSLFVSSQLAAFAFSAGMQCVFFLLYFIAFFSTLTFGPVDKIDDWLTIEHFTISLVTPSGNLLRTLLLTLNEFSLACKGRAHAPYPGAIDVFGGPILYLICQFFILMSFLVWWDSGGRFHLLKRGGKQHDTEKLAALDDPASEELSRIQSGNDGLRVLHLSRSFGSNRAVEDMSFGIRKSETFALLGPNGAGKSTTISLIRGDIFPTGHDSEVFVENISLSNNRTAARNHLGVCPQFDAIDSMTVIEHLRFYARARGVPDVEQNVNEVMAAVGLLPYSRRMAAKLSGGNKRKLSLAIALMGNPSVLLLDEPSSGMDAAAKRIMWRVLASVTSGRALLITTHSMEEADALCQRAGIMAGSMLALGTTETLRRRHGDAYHVHIVHRDAPHTGTQDMENMREWVSSNIAGAEIEDRTYHGQLRFSVPNTHSVINKETGRRHGAGMIFDLLERNKQNMGFAYYSVSPTTLDQVFLNVVKRHNVQEENYASKHVGDRRPRSWKNMWLK